MTLLWQKRRSEFNHDWLKNQYLIALSSWLNLLDDKIEDEILERTFVSSTLPEWEQHRNAAFTLPQDFEQAMSPRTLFDTLPLSNCDADTRGWLGDLIHELWLIRYSVSKLISDAIENAQLTDLSYKRLQTELRGIETTTRADDLRPLRYLFSDFRGRCISLSKVIEKFPSEVRTA